MDLLVEEVMRRNVATIAPDVTLPDLEKSFVSKGVSGFPVVERGELVGLVSRSDIVRQLVWEQELAEATSDYYFDSDGFHEVPLVSFDAIADRVGERVQRLTVGDVMSRALLKAAPDHTLRQAAQTMADNGIHRLPVTHGDRLVGLLSSLDVVRLVANRRLKS